MLDILAFSFFARDATGLLKGGLFHGVSDGPLIFSLFELAVKHISNVDWLWSLRLLLALIFFCELSYRLQLESRTILPIHTEISGSGLASPIKLRVSLLSPYTWSVTSLP